jgi:hypothetical protein
MKLDIIKLNNGGKKKIEIDSKNPLKPDSDDHEYIVVLRGPSGVIFHDGQNFRVTNFLQDNKRVNLIFKSRYTKIKPIKEAIPRSIWIEIRGSAASLNEAINIFSNAGLTLAQYFSFCANAPIGELEAEIAFDNTPTKKEKREYFQQFLLDENIRPYMGRYLDIPSAENVLSAIMKHQDHERLHRAMVHYVHAIKHWKPGKDIFSLAHLYMGMEALTPVALRQYLEDNCYN